jgi:hypothetical protein
MNTLKKPLGVDEVAQAILELNGNVAAVSRRLGVSRSTIERRCKSSPTLAETLHTARETMLDNVESSLYSQALSGEGWAVCFFLKTQGKARGYVERVEHTGKDGADLVAKPDATVSAIVHGVVEESLGGPDAPSPQPGDILPRGFPQPE